MRDVNGVFARGRRAIDDAVKAAAKRQAAFSFFVDEIFLKRQGRTMTLQEFEKFRISLEQHKFHADSLDPLEYGIQRDNFRKERLQKLIATGARVDSKTVRAKVERWKRQLLRLDRNRARLESLRKEIVSGKLRVEVAQQKPMRLLASEQRDARA